MSALPFLKWAGGKRKLVPEILKHVPAKFGAYHEPFLGGGALYFHLAPTGGAFLSDTNSRLIRAYRAVRDELPSVIALLREMKYERDYYNDVRTWAIDLFEEDFRVAAWFIYLNRCGFNGLYRVNKAGSFNVPFGRYPDSHQVLPKDLVDRLHACRDVLLGDKKILSCSDFERRLAVVKPGDLVYLDPPYVPLSATSDFTGYDSSGFGPQDQKRLRDFAASCVVLGATVIASNSSAPTAVDLWSVEPFVVHRVSASRAVNSDASKRVAIEEILAVGRPR